MRFALRQGRRLGDDRDHLLREHVEGIAQEARGLDESLVHGASGGGAGDEVGAVFGKDNAFTGRSDVVASAADALHATGDRWRRLDLDDEVDRAHIDAEFERRSCDQGFDAACLEQFFNLGALRGGERAVMGAGEGLAGEFVDRACEAFGGAAIVDEDESRGSGADDFEQSRIDCAPHGSSFRAFRCGAAWQLVDEAEAGHVFDGDLDFQFEALGLFGVDDGDGAKSSCGLALFAGGVLFFHLCQQGFIGGPSRWPRVGASEEVGDLFKRALGCR